MKSLRSTLQFYLLKLGLCRRPENLNNCQSGFQNRNVMFETNNLCDVNSKSVVYRQIQMKLSGRVQNAKEVNLKNDEMSDYW